MVDRKERQCFGALEVPGRNQSVAGLAGRVDVALAQEPAELRVIEGGVEISGEDEGNVTGRRQCRQLTPPPGRGGR